MMSSLHSTLSQLSILLSSSIRVAGGELFEKLSREEIISEKEVVFFVKQILQGVRCMHKKGILHLDLKVGLVLVSF